MRVSQAPIALVVFSLLAAGAAPALPPPAGAAPVMAQAVPARAPGRSVAHAQTNVDALGLASVRRLFHALERERASRGDDGTVAAWTDVSIVMAAVTGVPAGAAVTFEELS